MNWKPPLLTINFLFQILTPCDVSFYSKTPFGGGAHMDVSTSDLILNISPATIRTMSAIAAGLSQTTVSCYNIPWQMKLETGFVVFIYPGNWNFSQGNIAVTVFVEQKQTCFHIFYVNKWNFIHVIYIKCMYCACWSMHYNVLWP